MPSTAVFLLTLSQIRPSQPTLHPAFVGTFKPGHLPVQAFVEAVHAGDIFWHAMPFNTQVEISDGPLLQYAVEMTHELDAKFGQKPKRTMSQVGSRP